MTTVLQIIPSLNTGGAEQACVDVAIGLKQAGHKAIVASSGGRRVEELEDHGIQHVKLNAASKNPGVIFDNGSWLTSFIREHKVDIVHARSRAPAWSAFMAARRAPCGFVTTFHAAYKFSNPFKKFYNGVMARGDRVIAISEFIARNIELNYRVRPDKIRVIPRGIDLDRYAHEKVDEKKRADLRKSWAITGDQPIILAPARLSPIKGQKVLINAMALLAATAQSGAIAVLLGDDQGRHGYVRELRELIHERGLDGSVRIAPPCNDMPAAYSLASMIVAPSVVEEGFGRVPVEAMAMGVPVVASDLGGYSENIRAGKTGWLVPPRDPQKLADAMLQILSQTPEQRAAMTSMALKEVTARYDKRKMVADTLAVYEEVRTARKV